MVSDGKSRHLVICALPVLVRYVSFGFFNVL